jgi:hypothetical protein
MLVSSVGYSEASQQTGILEATLRQWARRFNWSVTRRHAQSVTTVTKPIAKALDDSLAAIGERSKLALAKAGEKAANHFRNQTGRQIAKESSAYKNVTDAASKLHGWDTRFQGEGFSLNILNLGGLVNIDERAP